MEKQKNILLLIVMFMVICICVCADDVPEKKKSYSQEISQSASKSRTRRNGAGNEQIQRDYDLPIAGNEKKEAESDCEMALISPQSIKGNGCPIIAADFYENMENYAQMEQFLRDCAEGRSGMIVTYEFGKEENVIRRKYIYDGQNLYVLAATAAWNKKHEPVLADISYTKVQEWKYTDNGWFCYQLCVPEWPEVTEIVDGSRMMRVRPLGKEQKEKSEKYVKGIGYQGNNLLCCDWDTDHMEQLDYNGLYEYLYQMKYGQVFPKKVYIKGIPQKEFEDLLMEYLPVTAEQLRQYAVFDEKTKCYVWQPLGCGNYVPTHFAASFPEVTKIMGNSDGTITLIVNAVCEMMSCEDAVIVHALTLRVDKDGHFQYLSNQIVEGKNNIPDYQYRVGSR